MAAITGLIFGLRELVPVVSTGVVYLLAVLLVSSYWGLWMGLATAVVSALAFNFFHIPPTGRFTIADDENWVALVTFLVAATVTSSLAGAARSRAEEADRRRREADLSAELARVLLSGSSVEDSLRSASQRIAQAFELPSVAIELGWADSDQRRRALPLIVEGSRIGTVLVPANTEPAVLDALQDRVVPGLETLVAAVRRREELESQVIETKALRRSNVVKTTILRSVSHDLRSPLTAITAAAGGLGSETLSEEERRELTVVISAESGRLSRLVDNLLDLSRLQAGGVQPRQDWIGVDEVIRRRHRHGARAPGGLRPSARPRAPAVNADAAQLERALANVLENAVRFAGDDPVAVRARAANRQMLIRISDHGPGIAKGGPRAGVRAVPPRLRRGRLRIRASGSRSRAASWRRTEAGSGRSRSRARARAS